MTCNDLILIAIPADAYDAMICFVFTFIAIPADAYVLNGYVLKRYVLKGYVLIRYCMCGMMLIDMHDMIYANNLLKNPATKRLSGKRFGTQRPNCAFNEEGNFNMFALSPLNMVMQRVPQPPVFSAKNMDK